MRDRIKAILEYLDINQTELCKRTGISKSSLSHIMSPNGRGGSFANNIEKILQAFPEINRNWLTTGHGSMTQIEDFHEKSLIQTLEDIELENNNTSVEESKSEVKTAYKQHIDKTNIVHDQNNVLSKNEFPLRESDLKKEEKRKIERIVIFYNDGTFTNHIPLDE